MKRLLFLLLVFILSALACGPSMVRVTPTPTKTPKIIKTLPPLTEPSPPVITAPTDTPAPAEMTPTPPPPTDTPLPTETPTPEPTPTETPVPPTPTPPPPPPTNTPAPPPPINTPPPPPPTQPPAPEGPKVYIELPDGNTYDAGEEIDFKIVVHDPKGIKSLTWGVFTQNLSPLIGGDKDCHGAVDCSLELEEDAPAIPGTYVIGADALNTAGVTKRGIGEIYVTE